jgi:hypothetical protein
MSAINSKAMLAAVHISLWAARKHDKRVSRQVANQHNSDEKAGRYNKRLLADGTKLEAIHNLAGQIRNYFYKITLPWSDEGSRILSADLYFEFTEKVREFEYEFWKAVDDFLAEYPEYIEAARTHLNTLFCEEDYPTIEKIREKFAIKLEILPIPIGEDFRVQLSEEQKEIIAHEIDSKVRQSLEDGTRHLWHRMYEVVSHFSAPLSDPDARLFESVFEKVEEMASLLPKLNINNDPALNDLAQQIKNQLCQNSVDALRRDKVLRADTAAKASSLVKQMNTTLCGVSADVENVGVPASAIDDVPANDARTVDVPTNSLSESAQLSMVDSLYTRMSAYMGTPAAA